LGPYVQKLRAFKLISDTYIVHTIFSFLFVTRTQINYFQTSVYFQTTPHVNEKPFNCIPNHGSPQASRIMENLLIILHVIHTSIQNMAFKNLQII
jgi:hypothetical protein